MDDIMDIAHVTKKGNTVDTLESYYVNKETKYNNQINEKLIVKPNAIFETLIHESPHRGHQNS